MDTNRGKVVCVWVGLGVCGYVCVRACVRACVCVGGGGGMKGRAGRERILD